MSAGISKPWREATDAELDTVSVSTGVYEICADDGEIIDIDYAGSRELFGLRSRLRRIVYELGVNGLKFRLEEHIQYQSRYVEVVLDYMAQHDGSLPERVACRRIPVHGRITPRR